MRRVLTLVVAAMALGAAPGNAGMLGATAVVRECGALVLLGSVLFGLAGLLRLFSRRKP